jgi:hypothetical protein
MIVIEIDSIATKSKSGVSAKGPWNMVFQQISISGHMQDGFPAKHPRESTIQLDSDNPEPYPVGRYTVSPEAFYFGDFDRFSLGRMKLQPIQAFFKDCEKQFGLTVNYGQQKAAA